MPRKAFLNHLAELSNDLTIDRISDIGRGEDDGQVLFIVRSSSDGPAYHVTAIVSDVSEYPNHHSYFLSVQDDAPANIASRLERLSNTDVGQSLPDFLRSLADKLFHVDPDTDTFMPDSQVDDDDFSGCDENQSMDDFDDDVFGMTSKPAIAGMADNNYHVTSTPMLRARIKADLFATKAAGFKVGVHGGLLSGHSCFLSVSCRIGKLGVSEEATKAWEVNKHDYLTLLINYQNGYKPMHDIVGTDSVQARRDVRFAIGINSTYKPTIQEAVAAFNVESKEDRHRREAMTEHESEREGFRNCFISRPLNELFDARLLQLLAYRGMGMPWDGAERFYNDNLGKPFPATNGLADGYLVEENENQAYPSIVNADHFKDSLPSERAFPLVAMQFLLRHFVRCNEFCLVCHCKLDMDLGAIKPYVCEKPLCLYQYMSLGFGPSVEHEILTQPQVVDLLVSFCYAQAGTGQKLKSFPAGLGLLVPPFNPFYAAQATHTSPGWPTTPRADSNTSQPKAPDNTTNLEALPPAARVAQFDVERCELLFEAGQACSLRAGDWIVIQMGSAADSRVHCRVASTTYYPTVSVSKPITAATPLNHTAQPPQPETGPAISRAVKVYVYERNFDLLDDEEKRRTIVYLLDLLPSVQELRQYVKKTAKGLSTWVDRLPPAVTSLLRWIIASCRACIFQVDDLDAAKDERERQAEHRLHGMPGWMQFRFAMGAPDKERRFVDAVSSTTARLNQAYPTIFAWHGSALPNWHSIIREGLHYNYVACGRAFGDGVYHSLHYGTSMGFASAGHNSSPAWPRSCLKVTNAMALSEIVNAPDEFRSHQPHLVVQHLDWIQTRYLFVRCGNTEIELADASCPPKNALEQDPSYTPQGCSNLKLVIPASAVNRPRQLKRQGKRLTKKLKGNSGSAIDPIDLDDFDDAASVQTLQEDLVIFTEDGTSTSGPSQPSKTTGQAIARPQAETDFIPGDLDISTLPLLQPPAYASPLGTKRLLGDFKAMVKAQETQPLHELGWYLNNDPDLMTNLYQWIVELHTFNPSLKLTEDLKRQNMTSVVLEIRFGKEFPISPPFVRVIRPRFLSFQQGGGGHVTLGGAICMELLTNNGWTAACTIESVLLQIKMAMESTDPRPARLAGGAASDYGILEAVEAFKRACRTHGWTIPADLRETTTDAAGAR